MHGNVHKRNYVSSRLNICIFIYDTSLFKTLLWVFVENECLILLSNKIIFFGLCIYISVLCILIILYFDLM